MNKINSLLAVALAFTLGACNYSNEFTGTYNGAPANLSAYSGNVNKYCVALTLNSAGATKSNFISAQAVYDENDIFAPKSFNTKGSQCAANQTEYLVGNRIAKVISTSQVSTIRSIGAYQCQQVTYNQYHYQEVITFDLKTIADDSLVGSFSGTGQVADYTDDSRPVYTGVIYNCRPYPGPGYPRPLPPRGYPRGPGYPRPYPGIGYPYYPGVSVNIGIIR